MFFEDFQTLRVQMYLNEKPWHYPKNLGDVLKSQGRGLGVSVGW